MWNERYGHSEFIYGKTPNTFLEQSIHHIPKNGRVLCLAEGEGRNAVFLAQQGFEVVAVDLSEVGLTKAQKLAQEKGVHITTYVADLMDYDFGIKQYDAIIAIWAHTPPKVRQRIHQQITPALKKSGVFILEAYTYRQTQLQAVGGPPATKPEMFLSLIILKEELPQLKRILAVEKNRMVLEGQMHQGFSAVVQFIGQKP